MSADVLLLGVLAGLDNVQVCSSLGLLALERGRVHLLAACFGASEVLAALAGMLLGHGVSASVAGIADRAGPMLVLACGAALLVMAWRRARLGQPVEAPLFVFGLPLTLSLDNLAAGAGIGLSQAPLLSSALAIGCISGAMSCLGLYGGAWVRRFLPARSELLVGACLCLLSIRMVIRDTN